MNVVLRRKAMKMAIKDLLLLRRIRTVVVTDETTDALEVSEKMEQIAEEHGCHAGYYVAGGDVFLWVYCGKKETEDLNEAFRPLNIRVTDAPMVAMPSRYRSKLIQQLKKK